MRRSTVITLLSVAVVALLVANGVKYGLLEDRFFVAHEKLIDGLAKIFAGALLLIGTLASYFRFFRGRTFSARADLDLSVNVMEGSPGHLLHAIDVKLHNLGAVPIWGPTAELRIHAFGEPAIEPEYVTAWKLRRERDGVERTIVIDPQERGQFHATREFDRKIWAVHYEVIVTSASQDAWHSMTTVPNRSPSGASEA